MKILTPTLFFVFYVIIFNTLTLSAKVNPEVLVNGRYLKLSSVTFDEKEKKSFLRFLVLRNSVYPVLPDSKILIEVYGENDEIIEEKTITRSNIQFGRIAKNNKRNVNFGSYLNTPEKRIKKIEVSLLDSEESISEKEKIEKEREEAKLKAAEEASKEKKEKVGNNRVERTLAKREIDESEYNDVDDELEPIL